MELGLMILLVVSWSFIAYKCVRAIFFQNKNKPRRQNSNSSHTFDTSNNSFENTLTHQDLPFADITDPEYYPNQCGVSVSEKLGFKD